MDQASYLWLDTAMTMLGIQGEDGPINGYDTREYKMNKLIFSRYAQKESTIVIMLLIIWLQ
jgi:hypothetical protein